MTESQFRNMSTDMKNKKLKKLYIGKEAYNDICCIISSVRCEIIKLFNYDVIIKKDINGNEYELK